MNYHITAYISLFVLINLLFTCSSNFLTIQTSFKNQKIQHSITTTSSSLCYIKSFYYKDEYLFPSHNEVEEMTTIPLPLPPIESIDTNYKKHTVRLPRETRSKIFTSKIKSTNDGYQNIKWLLQPVEWLNETYYITNGLYKNQHICASHVHLDPFFYRRKVNLVEMNQESLKTNRKCMWRFERIDKNVFYIWNSYYLEPFYAGSYFLKEINSNKRNVFTYYQPPDSQQFLWYLNCSLN